MTIITHCWVEGLGAMMRAALPDGKGGSTTQRKLQLKMPVCVRFDTDIDKVFFIVSPNILSNILDNTIYDC